MSELKCPFCGQELKHEKITGIYCCPTIFIDCPLGSGTGAFGTKELWQELIRTRKALEIAVDALKRIAGTNKECDIGWKMIEMKNNSHDTLNQIKTVLEQKE